MTTQSISYVTTTTFEAIAERIHNASRITITTHRKPDGDAIGSVVGMYRALRSIGKDVGVLIAGPLEHGLAIIAGDTPIRFIEVDGFPEETPEDMWKSLDLNDKLDASYTPSFIFYPYPKTELAEYCLEKGYLTAENYKKVKQGYGSYHTTGWLSLPYMDEVQKFAKVLPVYTVVPKFLRPLIRKILKLKYGFIHKLLAVIAIPMIDPQEFMIRVKEMPRMFFATRRALKDDNWKKTPRKDNARKKYTCIQ